MKNITIEDFEEWIFALSDKEEEFKEIFKNENNIDLDYSIDSLDYVEKWLLEKFKTKENLLAEENKEIFDLIVSYIGGVFRRNLEGKWEIDLKNEKNAYYRLPVIVNEQVPSPVSPHTLITASFSRNKGNFISTVLKNTIKSKSNN
ncbi:hypothetical protein H5J24_10460 [Chryseobacterium capnotolerans]|uniref:hypothetical protein n=1 Tax=Chryseobacterium TaxID=59732 RepID=UPI00083A8E22|nr:MULTISPECIES: hypothetical protein [Chryseobacterium]UHO40356.1 hypothetical protein H5J24_10460 [Chryseobacterium capnotolerans]